jgi:serine/threonine-protein kinase
MVQASCPDIRTLEALLSVDAIGNDPDELVQHLETCADCQRILQTLIGDSAVWEDAVRDLNHAGQEEPALRQLVEQLRCEDTESAEELSFLQPADKPGLLGLLGEYEVHEEIGRGGMGVVLKAFDARLNRVVAIKVLSPSLSCSPSARRRFTREAKAAAAVCHENIVAVHAVNEMDGLPYLVMQYVPGESLQTRLDRNGPLELTEIVRIGLQTALGLAAAHAQGLIHRDIKPANLLLEDSVARVKITDFGLARMTDDVQLTQNGMVAGTPAYMSPEQARGESVDHRADLFSLGSVLYAMCTGAPPFGGSTAMAVLRQVSEQAPPAVRDLNGEIPDWLQTVIARLMAKDPAERIQRAAEVALLLEGYLAHLSQPERFPMPPVVAGPVATARECANPATARFLRSRRWICYGALLLLVPLCVWLFQIDRVDPHSRAMRGEQVYDFRGREVPPGMSPMSAGSEQFVKVEDEGLRITLPGDRGNAFYPAGFAMPVQIEGDFEITLALEILQADKPELGARSYGVGVLLSLNEVARIGLLMRAEGMVVSWDRWDTAHGMRDFRNGASPCTSQKGRIRLKRARNNLSYSWSPEYEGNEYQQVSQYDLGGEDIKELRLETAVNLGSRRGALDVRLIELRVNASNPGADQLFASSEERAAQTRDRLIIPLILGLAITLAIPAGWLLIRLRRQTRTHRAASGVDHAPSGKPNPAKPSISVRCPGCGQALRGKEELAGKKVRCPQCGSAVVVPKR